MPRKRKHNNEEEGASSDPGEESEKVLHDYARTLATNRGAAHRRSDPGSIGGFNILSTIANRYRATRRVEVLEIDEDAPETSTGKADYIQSIDEWEMEDLSFDGKMTSLGREQVGGGSAVTQAVHSVSSDSEEDELELTVVHTKEGDRCKAEEEEGILCLGAKNRVTTVYEDTEIITIDEAPLSLSPSKEKKDDRIPARIACAQPDFIPLPPDPRSVPGGMSADPSAVSEPVQITVDSVEEARKQKAEARKAKKAKAAARKLAQGIQPKQGGQVTGNAIGRLVGGGGAANPNSHALPLNSVPLNPMRRFPPLPVPLLPPPLPPPQPLLSYVHPRNQQYRPASSFAQQYRPASSYNAPNPYPFPPPPRVHGFFQPNPGVRFPNQAGNHAQNEQRCPAGGMDGVDDCLTRDGHPRVWQYEEETHSMPPNPCAVPFRLCSYNILCQETIGGTAHLYRHLGQTPQELQRCLSWDDVRWPLLREELCRMDADVICMQEVLKAHLLKDIAPFLERNGYAHHYKQKTIDLHGDGCAIFVRRNRFNIEDYRNVEYAVKDPACPDKFHPVLNRGQIGQIARLRCTRTGASVLVSNTHILFNERRADVKLAQISMLLANVHDMRGDNEDEPVVMVGDWNLEATSPLYRYIVDSKLDTSFVSAASGSGQCGRSVCNAPQSALLSSETLCAAGIGRDGKLYQCSDPALYAVNESAPCEYWHQLCLESAYKHKDDRGRVEVSTYHKGIGNVDFIFYSVDKEGVKKEEGTSNRLRLLRRLSLPVREPGRMQMHMMPWPNHNVPSDHIPLLADFALST